MNKKIYQISIIIVLGVLFFSCTEKETVKPIENSLTDIDGNTYKIVKIGEQTWMAENLKVTKYPDGTEIPLVTDDYEWAILEDNFTDDAYCYYNNNNDNEKDKYGALYTYAAAKDACPDGWHLPTDDEWKTLEMHLGLSLEEADNNGWRGSDQGAKLKSTSGWNNEGNGTDDYGFSAKPGGFRYSYPGFFYSIGEGGYWWSTFGEGLAYPRSLEDKETKIYREWNRASNGFSVRCVKD